MSAVEAPSTKKSTELTLIDKLSRLSYSQTLKLLGTDAPKWLRAGDRWDFRIESVSTSSHTCSKSPISWANPFV